jgi:hypothetical protein
VLYADSKAATEGADASTPARHVDCKAATEGADASTPALHVDSKTVGPAPKYRRLRSVFPPMSDTPAEDASYLNVTSM